MGVENLERTIDEVLGKDEKCEPVSKLKRCSDCGKEYSRYTSPEAKCNKKGCRGVIR